MIKNRLVTRFCGLLLLIFTQYAFAEQAEQAEQTEQTKQENKAKQQESAVKITTGVPEGFEDLLDEQLTLVDVYYNAGLVGSTLARYTAETFEFESPAEVLSLLNNIESEAEVLTRLSQPLSPNSALACFYQGQANCGLLNPQSVGVIFDESLLRVDLFINPRLQKQALFIVDKYLPESTAGTALINAFSIVASGGDEFEDRYTARLNSLLSYDNYRLNSDIESNDENGGRLDHLSLTYEYRDLEYQVGSFRSFSLPSSFYSQRDLLGFRIQNSLASRTDLEQVSGTEIFLFLNERSRIEIFKDGQLIDTQIYQAGNIQLNTQEFPSGAYNVEVRVVGDSGRGTYRNLFFLKITITAAKI